MPKEELEGFGDLLEVGEDFTSVEEETTRPNSISLSELKQAIIPLKPLFTNEKESVSSNSLALQFTEEGIFVYVNTILGKSKMKVGTKNFDGGFVGKTIIVEYTPFYYMCQSDSSEDVQMTIKEDFLELVTNSYRTNVPIVDAPADVIVFDVPTEFGETVKLSQAHIKRLQELSRLITTLANRTEDKKAYIDTEGRALSDLLLVMSRVKVHNMPMTLSLRTMDMDLITGFFLDEVEVNLSVTDTYLYFQSLDGDILLSIPVIVASDLETINETFKFYKDKKPQKIELSLERCETGVGLASKIVGADYFGEILIDKGWAVLEVRSRGGKDFRYKLQKLDVKEIPKIKFQLKLLIAAINSIKKASGEDVMYLYLFSDSVFLLKAPGIELLFGGNVI